MYIYIKKWLRHFFFFSLAFLIIHFILQLWKIWELKFICLSPLSIYILRPSESLSISRRHRKIYIYIKKVEKKEQAKKLFYKIRFCEWFLLTAVKIHRNLTRHFCRYTDLRTLILESCKNREIFLSCKYSPNKR